jgi:uncharacterized membrane protein YphA (DoxX/SURF4 family)
MVSFKSAWSRARHVTIILVILFGLSTRASAHVKWFVEQKPGADFMPFSVAEPAVQFAIPILMMVVVITIGINRLMPEPPQGVIDFGNQWKNGILYLVQVLVGVSLLITAYNGAIIAPHLKDGGEMMLVFRMVEATAGVLLITNLWVPAAAALLLVLLLGGSLVFGSATLLEYSNLLGIAVFLGLMTVPAKYRLAKYRAWALPLLRVFTGVALIALAFTEKLLNPEMAMRFLAEHKMNFMRSIGVEAYSDYLFVLSAGTVEVLFGLILLLGLVTRTNILALAFFLVASNTYFFMTGGNLNGALEFFGHMPLFAAAILFIIYGAGNKLISFPRAPMPASPVQPHSSGPV